MKSLINFDEIETLFFSVINDLEKFLDKLTLVGGWVPYVYVKFLWKNLSLKPVATADVDFGLNEIKTKVPSETIFNVLSKLDYTEHHFEMNKIYPVILHKMNKIPLHFITAPNFNKKMIENFVGREINVDKIDKFDFLLRNKMNITIKHSSQPKIFNICCPKPSAFLYHKGATFIDRDDEQKRAKDLHYIYFILRYCPDLGTILGEVSDFYKNGYLKLITDNLDKFFARKTSPGCLMVEKENGPDYYLTDLRSDIFEKFKKLRDILNRRHG